MEKVNGVGLHRARKLQSKAAVKNVQRRLFDGLKGADFRLDVVLHFQLIKAVVVSTRVIQEHIERVSQDVLDSLEEGHSVRESE